MVKKLLSLILVFLLINGSGSISTAASGVGRILKVIEFENGNPLSKPCEVETEENTVVVEKDSEKNSNVLKISQKNGYAFVQQSISSPPVRLILSADMKFDKIGGNILAFNFGKKRNITITAENKIVSHLDGVTLYTLENEKWYNLSTVFNLTEGTFDFYVDYQKVNTAPQTLNWPDDGKIASWRLYAADGGGDTQWLIDNMAIYEGDAPVSADELNAIMQNIDRKSAYFDNEDIEKALEGSVAVNYVSNTLYANGRKLPLSAKCLSENGKILLPAEDIFAIFNLSYSISGENCYNQNLGTLKADKTVDGTFYAEAEKLFKNYLGKNYFHDGKCLMISGDGEYKGQGDEALIFETGNYLVYERPEREKLREDFEKTTKKGEHPRLMVKNADVERIKKYIEDENEFVVNVYENVIKLANYYCTQDTPKYNLSSSSQLLEQSRALLKRTQNLGFAYLLTENEKYALKTIENLEAVAAFPDWNHHTHYLDTGEMAAAFSIGLDYIYNYLEENNLTDKITLFKNTLKNFVIIPARATHYSSGFKYVNNWNSVVNGGIVMSALMLCDEEGYEDTAFDTIEKSIKGLEYMMPAFLPDGGWEESSSYWNLMMRYLMRMVGSIESAFGKDYGITDFQGIKNSGMFAAYVQGNCGLYNYHDASLQSPDWDTFLWFATSFGREDYAALRLFNLDGNGGSGGIYDLIYYRDTYKNADIEDILKKDGYIGGVELISLRTSWKDKNGFYIGAHGGYGQVPHWNLDSGTFVLDALGERFASDLGSDSYSLDGYINTKSYLYYRKRTEGQNCVVINPDESMGQVYEAFSPIEKFVSKKCGSYAVMDLSDAYSENAESYRRGFMLSENRSAAVVRDEIDLKKENSQTYWFMHTKADINIEGDRVLLTIGEKKLLMQCSVEGAESYEILKMDALPLPTSPNPDGQSKNEEYKKIAVKVNGGDKISVTVHFSEYQEGEENFFAPKSIENWEVYDNTKAFVLSSSLTVGDKKLSSGNEGYFGGSIKIFNPDTPVNGKMFICIYEGDNLKDVKIKKVSLSGGENTVEIEKDKHIKITDKTKIVIFMLDKNMSDILVKEVIL